MRNLLDEVATIRTVTRVREKYDELIGRFEGLEVDRPIGIVYLSPVRHRLPGVQGTFHSITFEELRGLELADFAGEWTLFRTLVLPVLT
jgi:hypothetical protein